MHKRLTDFLRRHAKANALNPLFETPLSLPLDIDDSSHHETLAQLQAILESIPDAVFNIGPKGRLKQLNSAACELLQLSEDQIRDKSLQENIDAFTQLLTNPEDFLAIAKETQEDRNAVVTGNIESKVGRQYECYTTPGFLNGEYISRIWYFRDVTDVKEKEHKLQKQAFYDSLTGLPNRALLTESICRAISRAQRNHLRIAVLFIDIDDFKKINDTAGHQEGDYVLQEVARRLQSTLRQSDIAGRLGGDEFIVVLEGISTQQQIITVHDKILQLFIEPFQTHERQYFASCSIGISTSPCDGNDPGVLIRKADMAMYQAKKRGKNTFHYFDENLERIALHRVNVDARLREAIEDGDFIFHYQPKIECLTGNVVGAEALIRWQDKTGDTIYPDNFIPVAEQIGLIDDITNWVIVQACKNIKIWGEEYGVTLPLSINISAIDFAHDTFVDVLLDAIEHYGIEPSLIEIELTESAIFEDTQHVKKSIERLKSHAIKVAIDDFGTGYSCLSYLQDLDVDFLKIDKSFVQGIGNNDKSIAIVKSIIDLGINLGIRVVAEGVEQPEHHAFLQADGCHIAQGYYYSKPIPEQAFLAFLKSHTKKSI